MDWKQAIREERAMLQSIVALLLSLADLADFACGRSRAMCSLLFWILRPAESAAWASVDCQFDEPPALRSGDARVDLMQLALRFRQLACILECEADLAYSCSPEGVSQSARYGIGWNLQVLADATKALDVVRLVQAPDTS